MLAKAAGVLEYRAVVEVVLGEGEQLRHHQIVDPEDRHRHRMDVENLRSREQVVVHAQASRPEDEVDEHVTVPCLVQPAFRGNLRAHARRGARVQGALRIVFMDHEVDVVLRRRAAARPCRDTAANGEPDVGLAQRGGSPPERVEERVVLESRHA